MAGTEHLPPHVQGLEVKPLRLVIAPQSLQRGRHVVQRVRHLRVISGQQAAPHLQRLPVAPLGRRVLAPLAREPSQAALALRHVEMLRSQLAHPDGKCLLEQRTGLVELPLLGEHRCEVVQIGREGQRVGRIRLPLDRHCLP